jgi:hypothetical protein
LRSVAFFVAWILACLLSVGQTLDQPLTEDKADSIATLKPMVAPDSTLVPNDSIPPEKSRTAPRDIETTINYHARDSMFFDLSNQNMIMYGETHIDYGNIQLDAERTEVNWIKRTIQSDFVLDSAGNKSGKPVFTDRDDVYVTDKIIYDFKTQKAKISGVVTEQDGAFMHGENVRKNEWNEMFISGALYTTCNLGDPHFFIEANQLKVIPGNKVVSGPFHLKFREVPTPLWGPFGMFPQPKEKASGIVMPVYGEEQRRGFFLRDGGYYFAISDYMDLRVTGDIYSKGGHALNFNQNYIKRYAYRGTMNFSYTKNVAGTLVNAGETNAYWLRWNHTPQSRGNSRFSASVSAGSTSYNANNNLIINDYERSITSQFASNISYSTKFQGTPYSLTANLRHNQNIQTQIVNLTLPEMTLNMTRIYPFKGLTKNTNSPIAKLNLSHTFSAKNELTNAPRSGFNFDVSNEYDDAQDTLVFNGANFDRIMDRSRLGARHSVPVSTSLNVLKYFTLTPSFSYDEVWYNRELRYTDYDANAGGVRVDTVDGFSRAGSWRSSASLNTRLYGLYPISWKGIQAVRHVITPSVSFSYNPDFGDPKYGVYSDVVVDENGNSRRLSKYEGFIYGSPPGGESRTMSFGVTNNFEMKVLDKKDSTGEAYKKIKILDNLSANSGYNFAADSFKLSTIGLSARTSFFQNKLTVQTGATLDPYIYRLISETETSTGRTVVQRRLDRYAWNNGQGLGQLSNINTSINFNLQGKSKSTASQNQANQFGNRNTPGQFGEDPYADPSLEETEQEREVRETIRDIQNNPDQYVDFNLPWSFRTSYTITKRKVGFEDAVVRQSVNFGGSLGLTDKTQVTFNSGYDFESKEFTSTRIGVHRDLHCWTLDFNWVPFGTYQSYFLTLRVKSPILQDLKVEKKRNFFDFFGN